MKPYINKGHIFISVGCGFRLFLHIYKVIKLEISKYSKDGQGNFVSPAAE
jgi:hypothetical protein